MTHLKSHPIFWQKLEQLIDSSEIHIDRPAGSAHPRYREIVYPLDYGYLFQTRSNDNEELDLWVGSDADQQLVGVVLTVDPGKREAEIKLLLGCTDGELAVIEKFFESKGMAALFVLREGAHEIDT